GGLPSAIESAVRSHQGTLSPDSSPAAAAMNRDLLLSLDRDIDLGEESLDPDMSVSISLGNTWELNEDWEIGALASVDQKTQVRNRKQLQRDYADPTVIYDVKDRTVEEENLTAAINLGVNYQNKHFLSTNSYLLQNDEDQSTITLGQDDNYQLSNGRQRKTYSARMEKRELMVNQLIGEHRFENGDFGFIQLPEFVTGINVNWIYSDSKATTDVPGAATVQAFNTL